MEMFGKEESIETGREGQGEEGKHREILGHECRTQKISVAFVLGQGQGKQQALGF